MRWIKRNHKYGDTRVIKRFALFPITIHTAEFSETRWLAIVYIRQRRIKGYWERPDCWVDEAFVAWDTYYDYIETVKVTE